MAGERLDMDDLSGVLRAITRDVGAREGLDPARLREIAKDQERPVSDRLAANLALLGLVHQGNRLLGAAAGNLPATGSRNPIPTPDR